MPVPSTIADLTTNEATNYPADSDSITATTRPSDYIRAHAAIIKTLEADIATTYATAASQTSGLAGKQDVDEQLTTLAGITAQQATDLAAVSTFIGTLLNDADAATARTTLGVSATADTVLDADFTGANQSIATSGYQKLPGGLILQWGETASIAYATPTLITYPIAFPTAVLTGHVESKTAPSTNSGNTYFAPTSLTQFTTENPDPESRVYRWFAVGY